MFGFVSLLTASLPQLREFGIATSIGIILCGVLAIFFLPAALSLLKPPTAVQRDRVLEGVLTRFIGRLAGFIMRHRAAVLVVSALVAVAFAVAMGSVRFDTNFTRYLRGHEAAVENNSACIDKFTGYVMREPLPQRARRCAQLLPRPRGAADIGPVRGRAARPIPTSSTCRRSPRTCGA